MLLEWTLDELHRLGVPALNPGDQGEVEEREVGDADQGDVRVLRELAPRDIGVNALIVGQVATDMAAEVPLKMRQQIAAQTLIGKVGRPEDISGAVAFLASEDARWVTGQTLGVNGGYLMR